MRESREGLGPRLTPFFGRHALSAMFPLLNVVCVCVYGSLEKLAVSFGVSVSINVMQSCVFSWRVYNVLA